MTRRRVLLVAAGLAVLIAIGVAVFLLSWRRPDRQTPETLRAQIAALEAERTDLRARLDALAIADPRLQGMPETPIRVGVPTTLADTFIRRIVGGVVDQVTLDLRNLRLRKRGSLRRVVHIGDWDLRIVVDRVLGTLRTADPKVAFGGDRVAVALPLTVAAGTGEATMRFVWNGRNVAGVVCGDLDVTQRVSGAVRPRTYPVSGSVVLRAGENGIVLEPRFPVIRVNLGVVPAEASWAAAQKILDERRGLCGFVIERVDIMGMLRRLVDKGFNVRLPTERIRPVALPVAFAPSLTVQDRQVALDVRIGGLAITEHAIWLGAHVAMSGDTAAPATTTIRE